MNKPLTEQRIRIRYGKQGALRFVGHLDLSKTWERVLRRAAVPVEYTQGFNPRPRMQFAAALQVGVTSESEFLDVWLTERLPGSFDDWIERLNATSPAGLRTYAIEDVPIRGDALPTLVSSAEYVFTFDSGVSPDDLRQRVAALLTAPQIERVRRDKPYDLRPLILGLTVTGGQTVIAEMVTGDRGMGRPDELLDALGFEPGSAQIHRRRLVLQPTPSPQQP
ncbi:MAG: DUF2344 domain-containing protein [Chloroflexi bacterium]|nr:DUF2344 domain-containing protein [Chloroflexota bacterium]